MKINKEIVIKSNTILLSIVLLDMLFIIGASSNIGATFGLKWMIRDVLNTWSISVITINIFFIIPLSIWVTNQKKGV